MRAILRILRNTDQGYPAYIGKATLISFIPATVVSAASFLIAPQAERPEFEGSIVYTAISVMAVGPWIETLLMWPILRVLKFFGQTPNYLALSSALIWGTLHSLLYPIWGVVILWSFFVFSISFLEWEKKSKLKAVSVTAIIHMCQNSVGIILIALASYG
jgi:hypothetical protein